MEMSNTAAQVRHEGRAELKLSTYTSIWLRTLHNDDPATVSAKKKKKKNAALCQALECLQMHKTGDEQNLVKVSIEKTVSFLSAF